MTTSISITTPETGPNPPPPVETPAERPAWLPPEYKTPEDLVKRTKDLQAEVTRLQQGKAAPAPADPPPADPPPADPAPVEPPANEPPKQDEKTPEQKQDEAAQKVADASGVDLAPYQQVYAETGDVPEEQRAELAEKFKSVLGEDARQIIDEYIDARKIVHANDRKMFYDEAGGEAQYKAMTQWAATNIPKDEAEAFNRQVNSGDRHAALFAIRGLRSKYEAVNGKEPTLITGGAGPVSQGGYGSAAEMRRDMNDPRYKTDPAFRKAVERKLSVSNW